MEQTLHDLGGIILNGLPTFFLVLILSVCVKYLYLKPLEKVLAERSRLTDGARKAAEESLKSAGGRASEYEAKLAAARSEIYADQAEFLRGVQAEQAARVAALKAETDRRIAEARAGIAAEAAAARAGLEAQTEVLAAQIADTILLRRPA